MKSVQELLEERRKKLAEENKGKDIKTLLTEKQAQDANQAPGAGILGGDMVSTAAGAGGRDILSSLSSFIQGAGNRADTMLGTTPEPKFAATSRRKLESALSPIEEQEFLSWYADYAAKQKLDPNPDDPRHYYDYRGFWKAQKEGKATGGIDPASGEYHLPDTWKKKGHPSYPEKQDTLDASLPLHERQKQQERPQSQAEQILMEHIGGLFGAGKGLGKEQENEESAARIATAAGYPGKGGTPATPSNKAAQVLAQLLGTGVEYLPYIMAAAPVGSAAAGAIGPVSAAHTPKALQILREAVRGGVSLGGAELLRNTVYGDLEPEELEKSVLIGAIADPIFSETLGFIARKLKGTKVAVRGQILQEGEIPVSLNKYDQATMKTFITEISRGNVKGARAVLSEGDAELLVQLYSNSPTFKKTVISIAKGKAFPTHVNVPAKEFFKSTNIGTQPPQAPAGAIREPGIHDAAALSRTGYKGFAISPEAVAPQPGVGTMKLPPPPKGGPDVIIGGSGMEPDQELEFISTQLRKYRKRVQDLKAKGKQPSAKVLEQIRSLENSFEVLQRNAQRGNPPTGIVGENRARAVPPGNDIPLAKYPEPGPRNIVPVPGKEGEIPIGHGEPLPPEYGQSSGETEKLTQERDALLEKIHGAAASEVEEMFNRPPLKAGEFPEKPKKPEPVKVTKESFQEQVAARKKQRQEEALQRIKDYQDNFYMTGPKDPSGKNRSLGQKIQDWEDGKTAAPPFIYGSAGKDTKPLSPAEGVTQADHARAKKLADTIQMNVAIVIHKSPQGIPTSKFFAFVQGWGPKDIEIPPDLYSNGNSIVAMEAADSFSGHNPEAHKYRSITDGAIESELRKEGIEDTLEISTQPSVAQRSEPIPPKEDTLPSGSVSPQSVPSMQGAFKAGSIIKHPNPKRGDLVVTGSDKEYVYFDDGSKVLTTAKWLKPAGEPTDPKAPEVTGESQPNPIKDITLTEMFDNWNEIIKGPNKAMTRHLLSEKISKTEDADELRALLGRAKQAGVGPFFPGMLNVAHKELYMDLTSRLQYLERHGLAKKQAPAQVIQGPWGEPKPGPGEYPESYGLDSGKERTPAPVPKKIDLKKAASMKKAAENMQKIIDEKYNPATAGQNITARRSRIIASMREDAERLEGEQSVLRALGEAWERGEVPEALENIKNRAQIRSLLFGKRFFEKGYSNGQFLENPSYDDHEDRVRLVKMGISTDAELKVAIEDLDSLLEGVGPSEAKKAAALAAKERDIMLNHSKVPGFFPTPRPVIDRMLYLISKVQPGEKILEPSAGKGNIAAVIKENGVDPDVVEINTSLQGLLADKGFNVKGSDFMEYNEGPYDKIIMNPPFEKGQDVDHIMHAYDLLSPGGELVAIVSEHPFFAKDKKSEAFMEFLAEVGTHEEPLDAGAFKNAERSTGVNGRIVVIEKPLGPTWKKPGEPAPVEAPPIKPKPKGTDLMKKARQELTMAGSMRGEIDGVSIKIVPNNRHEGNFGLQITVDGNRLQPNWESPLNNHSLAEAPNIAMNLLADLQEGDISKADLIAQAGDKEQRVVRSTAGGKAAIKTNAGDTLEVEYQLVDADDLIVSHKVNFEPNPDYPSELQPRERGRITAQSQVEKILSKLDPERLGSSLMASEGAPIVGDDMVVESGNGRTLALQLLYDRGVGAARERYMSWLQEAAEDFGIDPAAIGEYTKPVLVRKRLTKVDRTKFAQDANESTVSLMSAAEQAQVDAGKLSTEMLKRFKINDNGDLLTGNGDFIQEFANIIPQNESGRFIAADGKVSQEGLQRVRNALFYKAFGDPSTLARMSESADDNVKGIINGLVQASPRIALLNDKIGQGTAFPLSISDETVRAVNTLANLRNEGTKVIDFINQNTLFGDDLSPLEKKILTYFDNNKRSAKKISKLYEEFAYLAESKGDPRMDKLFAVEDPTTEEVFEAALKAVSGSDKGKQGALFIKESAATSGKQISSSSQIEKSKGSKTSPQKMTASGNPTRGMEPERPVAAPGEIIPPTRVREIKEKIDELFLPWRERRLGRGMRGVLGWFRPSTHVIRSRYAYDITVAMHELGHYLDDVLQLSPRHPNEIQELLTYGKQTSGKDYTPSQIIAEGIAQFMQHWSINPEQAIQEFPSYSKLWLNAIDSNPEIKAKIGEVVKLVRDYYKQSPAVRLQMNIVHSSDRKLQNKSMGERLHQFGVNAYTNWVDELYPLFPVDQAVADSMGIKNVDDVPDQFRVYLQGRAAAGYGHRAKEEIETYMKILEQVPEAQGPQLENFVTCMRAIDYWKNGLEPGIGLTPQEAMEVVRATPPEIAKVGFEIVDYLNGLTSRTLVSTGRLTPEQLKEWSDKEIDPETGWAKGRWPHYVRFVRENENGIGDPDAFSGVRKSGRANQFGNLPTPGSLKQTKGVGDLAAIKPIMNPLEEIGKTIIEYHAFKAKNDVAKSFIDIAKLPHMGRISEIVTGPASEKDGVFQVWDKGEQVFIATEPDIYRAVMGIGTRLTPNHPVWKVMSVVSDFGKKSFTRWNPAFTVRNFTRDPFDVLRNTDKKGAIYLQHHIKGLAMILSDDPMVHEAIANGVLYSGISERDLKPFLEDIKTAYGATKLHQIENLADPKVWFEAMGKLNENIEVAPKIAEYAYRRGMGQSPLRAAVGAREINLDFQRKGRFGKAVNQIVPFFNPAIQGTDKFVRMHKEHPVRSLARMLLWVTLPTVLIWNKYKDDEEYRSFSKRLKDNFWVFKIGDTWYRYSKPHEASFLYSSLLERSLDYACNKDPRAMEGIGKNAWQTYVPDIIPLLISPWIELGRNERSYFGSPIVSESKQRLPKEQQYNAGTSSTAKALGKIFSVSPLQLDYLYQSYTGAPGRLVLSGAEAIIEGILGKKGVPDPAKKWSEKPFIRGFTVQPYKGSQKVSDFYDILDELEKGHNGAYAQRKSYIDEGPYRLFTQTSRQLGKLWKDVARIREGKASPEAKREQMDKRYIQANKIATLALDSYYKMKAKSRRE